MKFIERAVGASLMTMHEWAIVATDFLLLAIIWTYAEV
jgi:hypothetical protein